MQTIDYQSENHGQILVERDGRCRIYLCEYGLVHLAWGANNLVYCPGDFFGLPYLFSALQEPCSMECLKGEQCVLDHGNGIVTLLYNSVKIPLTVDECQHIHLALQEATERLYALKNNGYFSNQK